MNPTPIIIDATGKPLGRLASRVALLLRGKHLPGFQANVQPLQKIRVTNISRVRVSTRTLEQKQYYRSSGHPGGLKATPMGTVFAKNPSEVFYRTVKGMLPANKLTKQLLMNLTVE
ncbi:MAG: 50S ribosomal protein L13 [Candidatus Kerfeldbacteria bacterium]|nr:50S ribosomal protein L13 [Candidatus Kerfeldbacteria bacterium]